MSSTREKMGQETSKPCKFSFNSSSSQSADFITTSVKGCFLVFFLVSVALVVYSVFASQSSFRFLRPECSAPIIPPDITPVCCTPDDRDYSPTNISHVVFGIGGSTKTWGHRSQYSRLWWQHNITRGFVWLEEEPSTPWPEDSPPYRVSSDWKRFRYTSSQSVVRLARVVVDSFRVGLPGVRWFVMGDDDTVFFPENLVAALAKYDHRRMFYVGGNSESVEQDVMHSFDMAFGGGGFAISYPLAARLAARMDGCLDRYYNFYGSDQRVWACVKELGVYLTMERGFHQIDVRGDMFGLLTAHPLAPIVSLHHLDYVEPLFPNLTQYQSLRSLIRVYNADPPQLMQQFYCYHDRYKWSVSISWGYAVQIYPWWLSPLELEKPLQTFKTWRSWSNGPFVFKTRPVSSNPCGRPIVYFVESIVENIKGETVTSYNKSVKSERPEKGCNPPHYARAVAIERVLVSALRMDCNDWKNPRRRYCEITSLQNGTMKVRIRK